MSTDLDTVSMLRDSVQRYTAEHYAFLQRWAVLDQPSGYSMRAWSDYATFGWLALRLPEDDGGIDADAVAVGALMEVVGSRLLMEPILASAVLGTGLLQKQGSDAQKAEWRPQLADGSLKLAFACEDSPGSVCELRGDKLSGSKISVLHGDIADRLIVSARNAYADGEPVLCIVDAAALQRRNYRLVDGRGAANVCFEVTPVERLGASHSAADAIAETLDEAAVALCAEALGAVCSLVAATNAYLQVRKQFGRAIGSNQALQHRMVGMYLLQEEVRALVAAAQRALSLQGAERTRIISGAKAYIGYAARCVANEAVQMHGGLGVTEELDVSHYFRRVMVINALFGSRDDHFERFVAASSEA